MSKNTTFGYSKSKEFLSNDTRNHVESFIGKHNLEVPNTADFKPFLYKTVEELLEVKSTHFWKNNNVRVLGRIFLEDDNCVIKAKLVTPLDTNEIGSIKLDMDLMEYRYSRGTLVEVFGYFYVDFNDGPQLKTVHIIPANGINIQSHYEVIKLRNKYVPEYNE